MMDQGRSCRRLAVNFMRRVNAAHACRVVGEAKWQEKTSTRRLPPHGRVHLMSRAQGRIGRRP